MDEKSLQAIEERFKAVTEKVFSEALPTMVNTTVDEKVKEMLSQIDFASYAKGSHKSYASFAKKQEFAEQIKALGETQGSTGGFLVSEEVNADIMRIAEDFGVVRKFARIMPMKVDKKPLPRLGSSVTVTWDGENTPGTQSQPKFEQVMLVASKLKGLTLIGNELIADADMSVVDYLMELFAEAFAGAEDQQALQGTGQPFTGILNDSGTNVYSMPSTKTAFSDVTITDLINTKAAVKTTVRRGATWLMHRTVWPIVQTLKDPSNQFLILAANPVLLSTAGSTTGEAGQVVGYIDNDPVVLCEKMPTLSDSGAGKPFIIYGNLKNLVIGDREGLTMAKSDSAVIAGESAFESDSTAVRFTRREAIAVALPAAFGVTKTAAS
jgi:HK97 family phage major capsid protein